MKNDFEGFAGTFRDSGRIVGLKIHHFTTVTSTMDVAWDLAKKGVVEGTVVVADHQSVGRGRFDRSWVSREGRDILCSIVLRPRVSLASELLMLAALAVVEVAESFGIHAGIKWPNDVEVAGKKLAGVIAESVSGPEVLGSRTALDVGSAPEHLVAVIGIGLNVNSGRSDYADAGLNPTSLSTELGKRIDRLMVFDKLLRSIDKHYSELSAGGSVVSAWRKKLTTLGRMVTIVSKNAGRTTKLHGLAHDVDSVGRLIVRDADGRDWPVAAGEVTVQEIK